MLIGASTASLYPMVTEEALAFLAENGVSNIEIFVNAEVELESDIAGKLRRIIREFDLNILSVHPLPTFEGLYLFSGYERRKHQAHELYKRYFDRAAEWGAEYIVVHGTKKDAFCPEERYFERFDELYEIGLPFGVKPVQENVFYCRSGDVEFLKRMSSALGERAGFVLDLKQAIRVGCTAFDFLEGIGDKVVHIHASDSGKDGDCLPIGKGEFDFPAFFKKLRELNYNKGIVVELYKEDYREPSEIADSVRSLEKFL